MRPPLVQKMYMALRGINASGSSRIVGHTTWPFYKEHMRSASEAVHTYNAFVGELNSASLQDTTAYLIPEERSAIDAEYHHLRAQTTS